MSLRTQKESGNKMFKEVIEATIMTDTTRKKINEREITLRNVGVCLDSYQ